ncbi:MAG: phage head-tail joining protein [Xanthobacteraceae bacterium]
MTLEEMTAQRDALLSARYRGVRTVEIDGRRVTYATDTEMAAAITDIERRIAAAQDGGRKRRILTSASKGL